MQVERVRYEIDWKEFRRGYSIFIPCLNPIAAKAEIKPVLKRLKIEVLTRTVIEEGIRGLRIWRL
jgi:hypothetical protein